MGIEYVRATDTTKGCSFALASSSPQAVGVLKRKTQVMGQLGKALPPGEESVTQLLVAGRTAPSRRHLPRSPAPSGPSWLFIWAGWGVGVG